MLQLAAGGGVFQVKFLHGAEHHAAAIAAQEGAQLVGGVGYSYIAHQVFGGYKIVEELAVEVEAVYLHHNGRVLQFGQLAQDAGVNGHSNAFAGAGGVPYHANAAIAVGLYRLQGLLQGVLYAEELVVLGAFLDQLAFVGLVEDVVAHVLQEALGHEQTFNKCFQREAVAEYITAVYTFPGGEPLQAAAVHTMQGGLALY